MIDIAYHFLRTLRYAPLLPLSWASHLVPRDRRLWVFGAWMGRRYADNSRYVFEYVAHHCPEIRPVWLTRNPAILAEVRRKGFECYLATSLRGFLVGCRAAVAVTTTGLLDVNAIAVSGSRRVSLWHGTPLKKILHDDCRYENKPHGPLVSRLKQLWYTVFAFLRPDDPHLVISPSDHVSKRFASAFRLPSEAIRVTGSPRADVILAKEPEQVPAVAEFKKRHRASRVILYAPTWRRERTDYFRTLDRPALESLLARHDAVFLIKSHILDQPPDLASFHQPGSRMIWLTESEAPDINLILPLTDVLLTDFSSIMFDYLLLGRPILYPLIDWDSYLAGERDLYDDFDSVTPGPRCMDWAATLEALDALLAGNDPYSKERERVCSIFNQYADTKNCERVVAVIKEVIGLAAEPEDACQTAYHPTQPQPH